MAKVAVSDTGRETLRDYRPVIVELLRPSHILYNDNITKHLGEDAHDFLKKSKRLERNGQVQEAVKELLDKIVQSRFPSLLEDITEALIEEDYETLGRLLINYQDVKDKENFKRFVAEHTSLKKVNAIDFADDLMSQNIMNESDKDVVEKAYIDANEAEKWEAMFVLLDLMARTKQNWYTSIMSALRCHDKYREIAKKIDPNIEPSLSNHKKYHLDSDVDYKEVLDCYGPFIAMHLKPSQILPDMFPFFAECDMEQQAQCLMESIDGKEKAGSIRGAVYELINVMKNMDDNRVFEKFVSALKNGGYQYVYEVIMNYVDIKAPIFKGLMMEHTPILMTVDPLQIIPHLLEHKLITDLDVEKVNADLRNDGRQKSVLMLLICTVYRKREDWFHCLMYAFKKSGYQHIVETIAPDFNEAKSMKSMQVVANAMEKRLSSRKQETTVDQPNDLNDDTKEHMVEYESVGGAAEQGLGSPAPLAETQLSPPTLALNTENIFPPAVDHHHTNSPVVRIGLTTSIGLAKSMHETSVKMMEGPSYTGVKSGHDVNPLGSDHRRDSIETTDSETANLNIATEDETNMKQINDKQIYNDEMLALQLSMNQEDFKEDSLESAIEYNGTEELLLRDYQMELAAPAIDGKNCIVVAPTGSGKTHVALYISKEHLESAALREHKILFIVPTVALVEQQYKQYRKYLPKSRQGDDYKILQLSGEAQADNKVPVPMLIKDYDVVVMTPQILVDTLKQGRLWLGDLFTMLIFDECHHTTRNHPYNAIMGLYVDKKLKSQKDGEHIFLPQIVGLTASVGVGKARNPEMTEKHILTLAANLDAEAISTVWTHMEELLAHCSKARQGVVEVRGRTSDPFLDDISKIMEEIEKTMRKVPTGDYEEEVSDLESKLIAPNDRGSQSYVNWLSTLEKKTAIIYEQKTRRVFVTCINQLKVYNNALIINNDCRTKDALEYIINELEELKEIRRTSLNTTEKALERLFKERENRLRAVSEDDFYQNPKLEALKRVLRKDYATKPDSRTIIFVRTRAMTQALENWMKEDSYLKTLKPNRLVGSNAPATRAGMTQTEQENILKYFKEGVHKVLIATSVAEEGLDVQKCNLVIRYEYVSNEIAMVQARGRGRADDARYILVTDREAGREIVNQIREEMMDETLRKLRLKTPEEFKRRIEEIQRKAKIERDMAAVEKKAVARLQSQRHQENMMYNLRCYKCDNFAVSSEDIRVINGQHHVVIDKDFGRRSRFISIPAKTFGREGDFQMTGKINCFKCLRDWGVRAKYKNVPIDIIKIEAFMIIDHRDMKTKVKKWKMCPFSVPEIDVYDLEIMLENLDTSI